MDPLKNNHVKFWGKRFDLSLKIKVAKDFEEFKYIDPLFHC
jgi:hypothetical protein